MTKTEIIKKLTATGAVTVIGTANPKIFIVLIKDTNKTFVVSLDTGKFKVCVPTKYTAKEFKFLNSILPETFYHYYTFGIINNIDSCDIKLDKSSKVLTKVIPSVLKEATVLPVESFVDILKDEGFDTSSLNSTNVKSEVERDFSKTLEDPEANERFELLKSQVASTKISDLSTFSLDAKLAFNAIKYGGQRLLYLEGPAGTGKTTFAYILGTVLGCPILNIQGDEGLTREDLLGKYIPDEENIGSYKYLEASLIKAASKGWGILIDEINMNLPSVNCLLNQFTDDTPTITLENGTILKKHPNFFVIATLNAGYSGTSELNTALKSRGLKIIFNALDEKEFINRINFYCKNTFNYCFTEQFYSKVFTFGNYVQELVKIYGESAEICLRNAQQFCALILSARLNYSEFATAISQAYINNLTMDNDNHSRLTELKDSTEYKKFVDELYSLYTYKELAFTDDADLLNLDELMENEELSSMPASKADDWDALLDDEAALEEAAESIMKGMVE